MGGERREGSIRGVTRLADASRRRGRWDLPLPQEVGSILDGWTDGWTDGRGTEAFGVCGLVVAAHRGRERLILALHRDRTGQKEREKKAITRAVRAHDGRSAWLMFWLGAVAAHR